MCRGGGVVGGGAESVWCRGLVCEPHCHGEKTVQMARGSQLLCGCFLFFESRSMDYFPGIFIKTHNVKESENPSTELSSKPVQLFFRTVSYKQTKEIEKVNLEESVVRISLETESEWDGLALNLQVNPDE